MAPPNQKQSPVAHDQHTKTEKSHYKHYEIGFDEKLPTNLIEDIEISGSLEKGEKVGLVISRSLLVLRIESKKWQQHGHLKVCDHIYMVNGQKVSRRTDFYHFFRHLEKTGGQFVFKIKRPIWCSDLETLPKGYDRAPGYKYHCGVLILFPGSSLGMNVKSYNSKVFVTNVEQNSVAEMACLIGDCVVAIDNTPVSITREFTELVTKALKQHKIALLTLERPVDAFAVSMVRIALNAEKTQQIDPRMAQDASQIGLEEAKRIQDGLVPDDAGKSIYRSKHGTSSSNTSNRRVSIHNETLQSEVEIGCDPCNPIFMQKAPPRPGPNSVRSKRSKRVKQANKDQPSTPLQKSKESVSSNNSTRPGEASSTSSTNNSAKPPSSENPRRKTV